MNNYTIKDLGGFIIITFYGKIGVEWSFGEVGFNSKGMTNEQVEKRINEWINHNRTKGIVNGG